MLTLLLLITCQIPPDPPRFGGQSQQPAKAPITLRDTRGRVVGTFTPAAGNIVLRDAQGRLTGSVTLRGSQATVKDSRGRVTAGGAKNGKR